MSAGRAVILAAVNKAEADAMRGRVYESEDGRVVVTLDGRSRVLSRDGRRLVGGDELLTRVK
ncbi:MAG: hypothetical protein KIT81_14150 [Alphaproteobacteria bacterium]|nr:hypothetical protein [Alphaproteobacteria bacterium]